MCGLGGVQWMIYLLPTGSKSVKILYVIIVENHNLSLGPALDIALGLGLELGYLLPLGTQLEYHQGETNLEHHLVWLGIVLRLGLEH